MPLVAASTLSACGIDLQSYGDPFFELAHRDAGVVDDASQPMDTAGRSAEGPRAGGAAPVKHDAGSGKRDAGEDEEDDDHERDAGTDAGRDDDDDDDVADGGKAGAGGSAGHAAGAGGAAGHAGSGGAVSGGHGGTGGSTSAAVSFSDIFTGIIAAGCSCHNGGAGGLDLATRNIAYTNLVGVASESCPGEQRVVPGNPSASVLFHSLSHTTLAGCRVPTMPRGNAQLSAAQVAQLQSWIAAGARDD